MFSRIMLILSLIFTFAFSCAVADEIAEKTISGTIILKTDVAQTTDITSLRIDVVNSAEAVVMSLLPNAIIENKQIVISKAKIDGLVDGTYKLIVSGDGYNTSSSKTFTMPSETDIIFEIMDFLQKPDKPHIISPSGTQFNTAINVIFAPFAEGISIYYTTDGSIPTVLSQKYSEGIAISTDLTLKAITVRDNVLSDVMEREFKFTHSISGKISLKSNISQISDINNFKIDVVNSLGNTVISLTPNEIIENNQIVVPKTELGNLANDTYKIVISGDGYCTSSSQKFVLPTVEDIVFLIIDFLTVPEKPKFKLSDTTHYNSAINVTFIPVAEKVKIHYTTDGSTPTVNSPLYIDGIGLSETSTIRAIAVEDNISSGISERRFTITRLRGNNTQSDNPSPINLNTTPVSAQSNSTSKAQIQPTKPLVATSIILSDIQGHWANEYINELCGMGAINGYEDKTFRPDNLITRAEAIKIIGCAAKLNTTFQVQFDFADESDIPYWAGRYIQAAVKRGVIKGYEDNTFKPLQNVSREELVVILMRAFGISESSSNDIKFSDKDNISDWSLGYINSAVGLSIATGYEDTTFKPKDLVTRAELSAMVIKCIYKNR